MPYSCLVSLENKFCSFDDSNVEPLELFKAENAVRELGGVPEEGCVVLASSDTAKAVTPFRGLAHNYVQTPIRRA